MNYKFSICIPVYNNEIYIKQAISSITNSRYDNYEVIVVNDCSTDNTRSVCEELAKSNNKIIIINNKENRHAFYSRLEAFKVASGDYIMCLDSDDYYEPNTLEIINNKINEYKGVDLLMFGDQIIKNNEIVDVFNFNEKYYDVNNISKFLMKTMLNNKYNSLCTKVIKTSIVKSIDIDENIEIIRGEDKYFSGYVYEKIESGLFINEVLYNYRYNLKGITRSYNYYIEYKDKEKFVDVFNKLNCFSKDDINKFTKYQYKSFKSQLIRISCLEIDYQSKKKLFNEIRNTNFYNHYLINLINEFGETIIISLFKKEKYRTLIIACKTTQLLHNVKKKMIKNERK